MANTLLTLPISTATTVNGKEGKFVTIAMHAFPNPALSQEAHLESISFPEH